MGKRAAIYARFSTDLQNERSTEDQIALCRSYCSREKLTVVATFDDKARSGGSIFGRDGLLSLMDQAKARAFDVVVVEALDRLSRDMEDLAGIHKRLTFGGIELRAVHEGVADTVTVGLRGLVGQLFREDGAKKVRRGMSSVIKSGRHAGGRAYGYRPVIGMPGQLAIVLGEADVVRRILSEFSAGRTPREIAGNLNRDGVAAPRGARWNASTITGETARGTGILRNQIFAGRIVWNRTRWIKNPDTGNRVPRINGTDEHEAVAAPHLRIVEDDLWTDVQARLSGRSRAPVVMTRRPKHLLSGLLRCGACGGGMAVHDRDRSGQVRIRCSTARESGTCSADRRYYLDRIEEAVLDGFRDRLRNPEQIKAYVAEYNQQRERLASKAIRNRARLEQRVAEAKRKLDRTIDELIDGKLTDEEADERLPRLRAAHAEAKAAFELADQPPQVVALHPAARTCYLDTIDRLAQVLRDHQEAGNERALLMADFRSLVDRVVVNGAGADGRYEVEVKGRLARLIGGDPFPEALKVVGGSLVAGERFCHSPHHVNIPWTTRVAA